MLEEQGMVGLAVHILLSVGTLRLMLLQKEVVVGKEYNRCKVWSKELML
jgi:hypothetical protein